MRVGVGACEWEEMWGAYGLCMHLCVLLHKHHKIIQFFFITICVYFSKNCEVTFQVPNTSDSVLDDTGKSRRLYFWLVLLCVIIFY